MPGRIDLHIGLSVPRETGALDDEHVEIGANCQEVEDSVGVGGCGQKRIFSAGQVQADLGIGNTTACLVDNGTGQSSGKLREHSRHSKQRDCEY